VSRGAALALAAVVLLAGVLGASRFMAALDRDPLPELYTLGGDFALPSTNGGDFGSADTRGRLVLLNFGFTACPDVCPTALSRMAAVRDGSALGPAELQLVFVTLDPARDTPGLLRDYLGYFGDDLVGLAGSEDAVREVADLYQVYYHKDDLGEGDYSLTHSSHIYLLDRRGRTRATFNASATVPAMVAAVTALHREES